VAGRQFAAADRKGHHGSGWTPGVLEEPGGRTAGGDNAVVNRHLRTVLTAKGYEVTLYESPRRPRHRQLAADLPEGSDPVDGLGAGHGASHLRHNAISLMATTIAEPITVTQEEVQPQPGADATTTAPPARPPRRSPAQHHRDLPQQHVT